MNKNSNGKKKIDENHEVEQLLQAAQDEMLLKLSVDSHISHISSNYLDADLDRRFQSLKSRPSIPPRSTSSQSQSRVDVDDGLKSVLGDDLYARFAALKAAASSSSSSSSSSNNNNNNNGVVVAPNLSVDDDEDEEDEVEKLIRWAKDSARLDPSPPSDDDDYDGKDSDNNTDSDDEPHQKKEHRK